MSVPIIEGWVLAVFKPGDRWNAAYVPTGAPVRIDLGAVEFLGWREQQYLLATATGAGRVEIIAADPDIVRQAVQYLRAQLNQEVPQ